MQSMVWHTAMKTEMQSPSVYAYLDQPLPQVLVAFSYVVWSGHILTCGKCQMLLL